jgi:hypothetical protein
MKTQLLLTLLLAGFASASFADQKLSSSEVERRAEFNYRMFCRGCHSPDGSGRNSVPTMKNFVGHFLSSQEGRDYLVQVPGSANAALDDEQLAQVLNWIILNIGGDSAAENFKRYSAAEVGELRKNPLFEVVEYRKRLVAKMNSKKT